LINNLSRAGTHNETSAADAYRAELEQNELVFEKTKQIIIDSLYIGRYNARISADLQREERKLKIQEMEAYLKFNRSMLQR
jgi:hypothetical protein